MKLKILFLIGILITVLACNKDDGSLPNIDGQYVGTFERDGLTTNVTLNLNNGEFSGESDRMHFPAIYYGNFSVKNSNKVKFDNKQGFFTAEFNPNLILNGIWGYSLKNDRLTLKNSLGDIYILIKEKYPIQE